MKVRIALFGREDSIQLARLYARDKNHIEIVPFTYENESGINKLVDQAIMCDVYIFTEHLLYLYVEEKIQKTDKPIVQINIDEYTLLTSLYRLHTKYNPVLHELSMDLPNNQTIENVLKELGIEDKAIYPFAYEDFHTVEDIIAHHEDLWNAGKIKYVLTSITEVKRRLEDQQIPVESMVTPIDNITEAIDEAFSIVTLNSSMSTQVVSGMIDIRHKPELLQSYGQSYLDDILHRIQDALDAFKFETDTSLFLNNKQQFVMFGTKNTIDYLTGSYRDFPLLNQIEKIMPSDVIVDIGFGLGLHALEAEEHAHLALEACQKLEQHTCYIVNERKETIGPIGVKKQLNTSALYRDLVHKARLSNQLSYNFIDFIEIRNNEPFSSNDIAEHYNVTKRSAERTINKLLNGKVIKHVGEERPYTKGRPRKLFQIFQ